MEAAGSPAVAAADAEEAGVWSSFEKSVAYMKEVAALYESAFGCSGRAEPVSRKIVTKAHLDEAHNQAQQALELLASNLLNASTTIVNTIEKHESDADQLKQKVASVQKTIRDRQAALDQEAIRTFYNLHKVSQSRPSLPVSTSRNVPREETEQPHHQLKLSLASEQCMQ